MKDSMNAEKKEAHDGRRTFLKGTAGVLGAAVFTGGSRRDDSAHAATMPEETLPIAAPQHANAELQSVAALPANVTRTWLGADFWANRLQDWRLRDGRIECLAGGTEAQICTVSVLTREIIRGRAAASLSVRAGFYENASGFSGFLLGGGSGQLDYRAAALVHGLSGEGGGILCAYEADGRVRFREHTNEQKPMDFAVLLSEEAIAQSPAQSSTAAALSTREVLLRLDITPQNNDRFELKLTASDPQNGSVLASAVRREIAEQEILGGLMLASSTAVEKTAAARCWFHDLRTGGAKISGHPERALGPILGTLYSLNGSVLKLSAQLMPIGDAESQTVKLQFRPMNANDGTGEWRDAASAKVEGGYTALFRVPGWDAARDWQYRAVYNSSGSDAPQASYYTGIIRRDPVNKDSLTIGVLGCVMPAYHALDRGINRREMPQADFLGRFTAKNLYHPHRELIENAGRHNPDLFVFNGDQIYEGSPTRPENRIAPVLDYLYKWYLWLWAFRDLTRNTPALLQTDDHDMYQGNIWGNGGRAAPEHDQNRGGYVCRPEWVNMVQRTQCGHNPDPYDPTPIEQGITVYYSKFRYGGVSFALLEDRKFKTSPQQGTDLDVHEASLLGARQEKLLEEWGKEDSPVKICLAQTCWACVQTSPAGRPLIDFDSNGYPKYNRDTAVRLLRDARALLLSGDQHMASLVRHGVEDYTDGIMQFTIPAGGVFWQRWFEPSPQLPNATRAQPQHTGDFEDAFGNRVRVLAIAQPRVSFAEYRKYNKGRNQVLGDRKLKREGYGIVRVNKRAEEFVLECWPYNVDPTRQGARQYEGWPYRLRFDELDGRRVVGNKRQS